MNEIEAPWYLQLKADLQQMERAGIVYTKHAIGKRILQDFDRFGKPQYGNKTVEMLAEDMDWSKRDLYCCIQFVRQYPELCDSITQLSWYRITHNVLPESTGREHVSTGEVEWYTPKAIIDTVRNVLGSIDCDPASCETAQETVQAKRYYTAETNGLEQSWAGNVFLNPPFVMPAVAEFASRAVTAIETRECSQIIMLTNNATDTDWFHSLCRAVDLVYFADGRLAFYNNNGQTLQARQGQALMYWGPNKRQFIEAFRSTGIIFERVE